MVLMGLVENNRLKRTALIAESEIPYWTPHGWIVIGRDPQTEHGDNV